MRHALAVLFLLAGCGPTPEELMVKYRPMVEAKFAKLKSLEAKVKAIPPLTTPPPKGTPNPAFTMPPTVVWVRDGELAVPGEKFTSGVISSSDYLHYCGNILKDGGEGRTAEIIEGYMGSCARWEYALVQREQEYRSPQLVGEGKFAPGLFRGEVLVFTLEDTPRYLGGWTWHATNNDSVSSYGEAITDSRLVQNLQAVIDARCAEAAHLGMPPLLAATP